MKIGSAKKVVDRGYGLEPVLPRDIIAIIIFGSGVARTIGGTLS